MSPWSKINDFYMFKTQMSCFKMRWRGKKSYHAWKNLSFFLYVEINMTSLWKDLNVPLTGLISTCSIFLLKPPEGQTAALQHIIISNMSPSCILWSFCSINTRIYCIYSDLWGSKVICLWCKRKMRTQNFRAFICWHTVSRVLCCIQLTALYQ